MSKKCERCNRNLCGNVIICRDCDLKDARTQAFKEVLEMDEHKVGWSDYVIIKKSKLKKMVKE